MRYPVGFEVTSVLICMCSKQIGTLLRKPSGRIRVLGPNSELIWQHLLERYSLYVTCLLYTSDAAERAFNSGFDGIELHYAHAYTMASFLSALNNRDDGYGGSAENRVKVPKAVLTEVRKRIGPNACLGLRFLGDDVVDGGLRIDDAMFYAHEFAKAGADFISVSKGGKFEDAKQPKVGDAAYATSPEVVVVHSWCFRA